MTSIRPLKSKPCQIALTALLISVMGCGTPAPEAPKEPGVWPQFRGPNGQGIAAESKLPHHWTPEKGIRWRTLLPDGISQPIVSGDRIFVAAGRDEDPENPSRVVIGLNAADGEILWETEILKAPEEKLHYQFSSLAMATPATDGESIFAYFGPNLASLSHDGEIKWNLNIDAQYFEQSRYGAATSPVLVDDKVLILRDLEHGDAAHSNLGWKSWLAAYSKADGSLIWKTEWEGTCCSYVTPTIAEIDGRKQVLITSSPKIKNFDLETGEELWTLDYPSVQVVPSSSLVGDLFIASGAVHDRLTAGFRLSGNGPEAKAEQLWSTHKQAPEIASPVVYEGTLYQVTEGGIVSALDAESGKPLRRWRLPPGPYRASMIAGDGKIFALSARGTVSIWEPRPSFKMLGTNHLPVKTGPYLAMGAAKDCLLFRSRRALYCVDGFEPEPEAEAEAETAEEAVKPGETAKPAEGEKPTETPGETVEPAGSGE